jgi:DNA-binding CsgD family transcriptional regulator
VSEVTEPAETPVGRPATRLIDRDSERRELDELVVGVRGGASRALVVHGEPGVGKTALLEYLARRAAGCRVVTAVGVQSEMELAFAALHQLVAPILDRLDALPTPQREALRITFGLGAGPVPDLFLVGLGVLGLVAEVAAERPLVCVVDDEQWLDRASAQVLSFVARRLGEESVALVFGTRVPGAELAGLPELAVTGLTEDDARVLLGSVVTGPLDVRVRDQIVAESDGNPLALLELPRGLTAPELAGKFALVTSLQMAMEERFRRRLDALPPRTRQFLTVAAADQTGNPVLVWGAADRLGVASEDAFPAIEAGLVEIGAQVQFRHPTVRSAAYAAASFGARQEAHRALAELTDPLADPDRRAWHLALAAPGPDEEVAAELERSAGRAQARGGLAAAAAFLERSARLSEDPVLRAERTLAAAAANLQAGAFDNALELLTTAESGPLDEFAGARVDLLRGQIAFASGLGSDAPPQLFKAAKRLEAFDPAMARETYLAAWGAALFAGRLAGAGNLVEVSRAALDLPRAAHPRVLDVLLEGLSLVMTDGLAVAAPTLRQATLAFAGADVTVEDRLRWGWLAQGAAAELWDEDTWTAIAVRQCEMAREVGAFEQLPLYLNSQAMGLAWRGDFPAAALLVAEFDAVCEATGSRMAPYAKMFLAALRGAEAEVGTLTGSALEEAATSGQGVNVLYANWVRAILCNSLGRYEEALSAALQATEYMPELFVSTWAVPDLIEASARAGNTEAARGALERLSETAQAGGTDHGRGLEARSRAILSKGDEAERFYREAVDRLSLTLLRPDLARTHLLFGEWLRRERRRNDARAHLRTAHEMFETMGMEAFAERARRELRATGETARKRTVEINRDLTPQEAQIATMARDGQTNPEIGARLFISPHTVEYHLRKVFTKLGINSRRQLYRVLA